MKLDKLTEITRSGVTDNEDLGDDHSRTAIKLVVRSSFAHDSAYEQQFAQLLSLPQFSAALERNILNGIQNTVRDFARNSNMPVGASWTDDFEVEVTVVPVQG